MAQTFQQIQKQIAVLQQQAESARKREISAIVVRIKEAIGAYGLTASDLGLSEPAHPFKARARKAGGVNGKRSLRGAKGEKSPAPVKFRDGDKTWVGRGKRPDWLREALAAGRQLEDFAVR